MSTTSNYVNFLNKVPMFHGLKKNQLERIAGRLSEREFSAGSQLVTQGQGGEGFFILYSGKADVVRERSDGTHVTVNQLQTGDFLGELALLDDGIRTATATATETTHCLVLTRWDFIALLREDADMSVTILEEMAKRFRLALDRF